MLGPVALSIFIQLHIILMDPNPNRICEQISKGGIFVETITVKSDLWTVSKSVCIVYPASMICNTRILAFRQFYETRRMLSEITTTHERGILSVFW